MGRERCDRATPRCLKLHALGCLVFSARERRFRSDLPEDVAHGSMIGFRIEFILEILTWPDEAKDF